MSRDYKFDILTGKTISSMTHIPKSEGGRNIIRIDFNDGDYAVIYIPTSFGLKIHIKNPIKGLDSFR